MEFLIFRCVDGKWWIRNLRGFASHIDAVAYAKKVWKSGMAVDLRFIDGKWYVWKML